MEESLGKGKNQEEQSSFSPWSSSSLPSGVLGYLSGAPRVSTRPEAGLTGPRTHILGVIGAFQRLGWEVRPYIVGDRVPSEWVVGDYSEKALYQSRVKRIAADLVRVGLGLIHGPRAVRELGRVDVVYERYGAFQALGWWFKRRGIPWILESNGLLFAESSRDRLSLGLPGLQREAERWAYHRCDLLVVTSPTFSHLIQRELGVSESKILVLPNGVDTRHMDPNQARPQRFFSGPTLGFVGAFFPWQGLDLLLRAMASLAQEGVEYNLVAIGDGPLREAWESLARDLGLDDRVRFLGRVPWEEVRDYIAGFDLGYAGAVPTSTGHMYFSPLKLYEYAAMGKPIVAAAHDDAKGLKADGGWLYLFRPGDQEDLKQALRQAYSERQLWPHYGKVNRQVVEKHHSWEARVATLLERITPLLPRK